MLQVILRKIDDYYNRKNRWWLAVLAGALFPLCLPPFNSTLHPIFTPMPLLAFAALVPFIFFATRTPRRRALVHTYLYCFTMSLVQYYWIGNVNVRGLWAVVLIGVVLISLAVGAFYFAAALALRFCVRHIPRLYIIVFPAIWVLIEYGRTLSDLRFPWSLLGYSSVGILPIAQFSSFTGVWGLSFLTVMGNVVIWELLRAVRSKENFRPQWLACSAWAAFVIGVFIWGTFRLSTDTSDPQTAKVALLQSYMDQFNWAANSVDSAFTISEQMVMEAARDNPEIMIFPESALHCYLMKRPEYNLKTLRWAEKTKIPIFAGALHWEHAESGVEDEYDVYNSAFLIDNGNITAYHKMVLVPFSEIMPFQAKFPIVSRVNLGDAGFKQGEEEALFRINDNLEFAPYICYEIIFPSFVQRRLKESTNLLVNITNDGWFGRSSGPYQHAAMSQMRSIENGISLSRSANSGISMHVDPYGRIIARTGLYERTILTTDVPTYRIITFYTRFGDWFVKFCFLLAAIGILAGFIKRRRPGEITNPLLVEEQKLAVAGGNGEFGMRNTELKVKSE
ncbi:MAG: apolipoprotein N-acyltransferase [Chitinispirillales bacterium]|jgi:apolipoprotein N-acyltransferase|nr:apolipoprotein N-acyltransferase [Chitinispirillales bacterium]